MRLTARHLCLAASLLAAPLLAAPAFAQVENGNTTPSPQSLAGQLAQPETELNAESHQLNLGLGFNKGTERTLLPLAPIEKDQLELTWRPGGKWGITLDLTSRSNNDILPREELAAGLSYQVTPRFRFGGGVTLKGDSLSRPSTNFQDEVSETSVRVESAFSF